MPLFNFKTLFFSNKVLFLYFINLLDKSKEIVYTYDNNGNILTKSVNGETVEYKHKEDSDQLVSFGDETFEYDSIGNPTTFRSMTAVFENGRHLELTAMIKM